MKRWLAGVLSCLFLFSCAQAQEDRHEQQLEAAREQIQGRWINFTGGALLDAAIEFCADGTAQVYTFDDWTLMPEERTLIPGGQPVTYSLLTKPETDGHGDVPYVLTLYGEAGIARCYDVGMEEAFGCETLDVRHGEAGGGYYREGQTLPPRSDGDWG